MNDQQTVRPIRDGFRAITPYLFAHDAARMIQFIADAFGGVEIFRKERPDGAITHAEMRVGDSMLMLGEATAEFGAMPASIYLRVADADESYRAALAVGATSVAEPKDQPHAGERYGGVKDPCGNIWWPAAPMSA